MSEKMIEQEAKTFLLEDHVLFTQGQQYLESGDTLSAGACYQEILKRDPHNCEALLRMSILAGSSGQTAAALQLAQELVRHNSEEPRYLMHLACCYQQAGAFREAIPSCQHAIHLKPDYVEAYCLLGDLKVELGELDTGRQSYRTAVELQPDFFHGYLCLGNLECRQEQYGMAVEHYCRAITVAPDSAEAHFALAFALQKLRDKDGALAALRRALELKPDFPQALLNLGNLFYDYGDLQDAAVIYRKLLQQYPFYVDAYLNLGNTLTDLGKLEDAISMYKAALLLAPDSANVHQKLANAHTLSSKWDDAGRCFEKALELNPRNAGLLNDYGNFFYRKRELLRSIELYKQALELEPEHALAHGNLGNALQDLGKFKQAIEHYEKAVALDPSLPGARYNLSLAYLGEGDYLRGWKEYECRWDFKILQLHRRAFPQPRWKGEPVEGKTVLLHCEQGLGDTMQFIRYAQLIAARGAKVIVETSSPLQRLLPSASGISQIVLRGNTLPPFDYHCPLMSLPLIFETTIDTIPSSFPYLMVSEEKRQAAYCALPGEGLRVGLVWAGNPKNRRDHLRSMPFEEFRPLFDIPGISFFSLQQGKATADLLHAPAHVSITDACSTASDFYDTAAIISTLDLVISVDTAVVHLTGAMGKPVWVLLPLIADWRWMQHRKDNDWYPSATLFRQQFDGDWKGVIREVGVTLRSMAANASANKKLPLAIDPLLVRSRSSRQVMPASIG